MTLAQDALSGTPSSSTVVQGEFPDVSKVPPAMLDYPCHEAAAMPYRSCKSAPI
jgi:hypothetical protein